MSSNAYRLYRWLFWLFFIFISYKFLTPSAHSGLKIPHLDKIVHAGIFFVLAWLGYQGYRLSPKIQLLWLGLYGALIEALQGMTGYRSAELLDWLADMLGVLLFFAANHYLLKFATNDKVQDKSNIKVKPNA